MVDLALEGIASLAWCGQVGCWWAVCSRSTDEAAAQHKSSARAARSTRRVKGTGTHTESDT